MSVVWYAGISWAAGRPKMRIFFGCLFLIFSDGTSYEWENNAMESGEPKSSTVYVSFVMASRVDNLRGDSVGRLRNSVEFFQFLCKVHNVSAEIIIVEWNPFQGQPKLIDALRPVVDTSSPVPVRVITVPHELHMTVEADTGQSFFEFLAKNTGARRARGEFILITNGDIVLNDDIFRALALRRLDTDAYFRVYMHIMKHAYAYTL